MGKPQKSSRNSTEQLCRHPGSRVSQKVYVKFVLHGSEIGQGKEFSSGLTGRHVGSRTLLVVGGSNEIFQGTDCPQGVIDQYEARFPPSQDQGLDPKFSRQFLLVSLVVVSFI